MKLLVVRMSSQNDDTLGWMFLDNDPECFTLEDEFRTVKVFEETRIPAGTYRITLHTAGTKHERYSGIYPAMHRGMLLLNDVPNFTGVLIHIGNKEDDTAGCILVGDGLKNNVDRKGYLSESARAYERLYPKVADALVTGEEVSIKITDYA